MALLVGSLTIGLILSLLALGVYISFRIFNFPDITTDASITLGAAVAAVLLTGGVHPAWATVAAFLAGAAAGCVTGILHTRFKIHKLLSGILVMTALYSVNLHVMGKSNVPLMEAVTFPSLAESAAGGVLGGATELGLLGWELSVRDAATLVFSLVVIALACVAVHLFFKTNIGTAMRATGDNDQMMRALGVNTGTMIVIGLALANGLIAFSGALLAQYQGFADVQMGIGMVVWGLASVIIGEALLRTRDLALTIVGVVMGSILFRLLVAVALRWGMSPNDLKLVTAAFVLCALILPGLLDKLRKRKTARKPAEA